uniref:NS1 n=1 Tax=uncultured densovirus TaxID=748192 RepID=A0A7L7YTT4_9VIRU|nr:NS1 [uncultured densovirus]
MSNVEEEGTRDVGGERCGGGVGGGGEGGGSELLSTAKPDSAKQPAVKRDQSGVPVGVREHAADGGTSTSKDRELPTWLAKSSKDLEQQYWKGFKKRCDRVLRELQNSDGQLVRDVFRFEDPRELQDFLNCVQRDGHYRRGLLQICREDSHVHVVHDCNFSNGTCRCDWWKKAKTYGANARRDRRATRRDSCRSRTAADVQNLLFYYCTKGRKTIYQKIRGEVERIPNEGYNLSESRLDGLPEIFREMEIQIPGDGAELQQWQPHIGDDEPDQRPSHDVPKRKKRKLGAQERIQLRVVELLETYPICPPEAIVKHQVWRSDPDLRFKNVGDREIKAAINSFKDSLTVYTINDFQTMYSKEMCEPIFSAGFGNFENYYYNIENSLNIMSELIEFQCGHDEDGVFDFVSTMFDVLERKIPKLNCMVIHSPPSAGKNYLFDAVKDYYLNCGHLCNANKYNSFPFQDAEGRRVVLWNEPNYSPEFLEPIKEILGGDSTSVNVKYQHDTPVYRTPVIVLTNNVVSFMTHPAFNDRVRIFNWSAAPFLANYDKKPNPLAVYHLFRKYGLIK